MAARNSLNPVAVYVVDSRK